MPEKPLPRRGVARVRHALARAAEATGTRLERLAQRLDPKDIGSPGDPSAAVVERDEGQSRPEPPTVTPVVVEPGPAPRRTPRPDAPSAPRAFRNLEEVARRRARLGEPHVEPIVRFVRDIRAERQDESVPDIDPDGGGTRSRALIVLEAPGGKATALGGSGFLSPDNNDQTAANFFALREQAGLPRQFIVHWNIVPWYVGGPGKVGNVTANDIAEGRPYLERLLELLPDVRVVVLMGRKAQKGWDRLAVMHSTLEVLRCPHPSPTVINTQPEARAEILAVLQRTRKLIADPEPADAAS
jgi:uracil-DNA glycosylase